jgi:hypothetical protein
MDPLTVCGVGWSLLTFQTSVELWNKLERLSLALINYLSSGVEFVCNIFFKKNNNDASYNVFFRRTDS